MLVKIADIIVDSLEFTVNHIWPVIRGILALIFLLCLLALPVLVIIGIWTMELSFLGSAILTCVTVIVAYGFLQISLD